VFVALPATNHGALRGSSPLPPEQSRLLLHGDEDQFRLDAGDQTKVPITMQ
jgi:hypothetical protein